MTTRRTFSLAALLVAGLSACAQTPVGQDTKSPPAPASAPAGMGNRMAMMDAHMTSMREMHDKMSRAQTPQERQALMADHMKLMQEGMNMMGGMGPGSMGMGGMMGPGMGMGGTPGSPADMAARQQMMEKRMEMMQSMMQMMMDRMPVQPPAAK